MTTTPSNNSSRNSPVNPRDQQWRYSQKAIVRYLIAPLALGLLSIIVTACGIPGKEQWWSTEDSVRGRFQGEVPREYLDAQAVLRKSVLLYSDVVERGTIEVPRAVRERALCVGVIPTLIRGGILVGGTYGSGVVACRDGGEWSYPAFIKLRGLSFGAQVGGTSSELLLYFMDEQAKLGLMRGDLSFGADATAVMGPKDYEESLTRRGTLAYSHNEGLFVGAALSGARLSSDDLRTTAYYGEYAYLSSVLDGSAHLPRTRMVNELWSQLSR